MSSYEEFGTDGINSDVSMKEGDFSECHRNSAKDLLIVKDD